MDILVIVDPWKHLFQRDRLAFPDLQEEVKSFGVFLNTVCKIERKKGTKIIFSLTSKYEDGDEFGDIMDEIEVFPEDLKSYTVGVAGILEDMKKNKIEINEIYFAGFHFGRCIHDHAKSSGIPEEIGLNIVINLSLLYPADLWVDRIKEHGVEQYNYCLWSQHGVERIEL